MAILESKIASPPPEASGPLSIREGEQKTSLSLRRGSTKCKALGEEVSFIQLFLAFSFALFALFPSCKTGNLPKTAENSKPKATASTYKKYSDKLGVTVDKNSNLKLLQEVIDWWGTPYKYGGESKAGADCSGFVQMVFLNVYNKKVPRSTKQQYEFCKKINKNQLKEGDLVFFETGGKGISHVGIFLREGKFAHASSSKGVIVNSLDEPYYVKSYRAAGRV